MKTINNLIKSTSKVCLILLGCLCLSGCIEDGNETIILETGTVLGIPSDSKADPNPTINDPNAYIPNIQYITEQTEGQYVMRIDMTGIQDPNTKGWLKLFGTGGNEQNIWVSVDNKPKGFLVKNTIDNTNNDKKAKNDIIFLVDNSGSMNEEADAIARDIISWAQKLSLNIDVQFGCVGYDGNITGALNLTTYEQMSEYLNRSKGTARTVGFEGEDAFTLQSAAYAYKNNSNECGTAALRFADENFTFRAGANRIYINFTDEPNQPNNKSSYSVTYVSNQNNWNTAQGTIHTVYSDSPNFQESLYLKEYPWRMSEYTGGTTLYASSSFTGITLDDLPVTNAIQNSYVIYFTNITEFMDGEPHQVKITILSEDENVRGEKIFYVVFGEKEQEEDSSDNNISQGYLTGNWQGITYEEKIYRNGIVIESSKEDLTKGMGCIDIFNCNGTYIHIDGGLEDINTNSYYGKWSLSSNKLSITDEYGDTENWTISELTNKKLIIESKETEGIYTYYEIMTYEKIN